MSDAIENAGGPTDHADIHRLNLAARLRDGERIVVPTLRSVESTSLLTSTASPCPPEVLPVVSPPTTDTPIDINAATLEQLQALPAIGEAMSKRIFDYRDLNGKFDTVSSPRLEELVIRC